MFLKSVGCFWTSIRYAENIKIFGAPGRIFDNDWWRSRVLTVFFMNFASSGQHAWRRRGSGDRRCYMKTARKALRVIPRGKHRLTVYRAHQVDFNKACQKVTRRALLSSRVIQRHGKSSSNMTRRAFLSSRVIQRQGKSSSNMLVKKWEKLSTKMKISQNLWIQLTSEQFSGLD